MAYRSMNNRVQLVIALQWFHVHWFYPHNNEMLGGKALTTFFLTDSNKSRLLTHHLGLESFSQKQSKGTQFVNTSYLQGAFGETFILGEKVG